MSMDNIMATNNNAHPAAPYQVHLAQSLSLAEQQLITAGLHLLPAACIKKVQTLASSTTSLKASDVIIKQLVDGRGLACPMPLLKTKVALRNIESNESLYVMATDPNSQADIVAFCQQTWQTNDSRSLQLLLNKSTTAKTSQSPTDKLTTAQFDTIFHFIITKTDSN